MDEISFKIKCIPPKHTAQGSSTILKNFKTGKFFIGKNWFKDMDSEMSMLDTVGKNFAVFCKSNKTGQNGLFICNSIMKSAVH